MGASRTTEDWLALARTLPRDPGVYIMRGADAEVLYVGKAKRLRDRVTSYFSKASDGRFFIYLLQDVLEDLDTVVTRTEKEALLLERELIQTHKPRFNVIWRDDKQYLCLRVDSSHEYPWVEVVRNMKKDGAKYFGPYHSASMARSTLRVVNRHFQLRTCRDSVLYNRKRPCLEYQIGRCPAPCVFEIDKPGYREQVGHVLMFLEGRGRELVSSLESSMWEAAEVQEYERAGRYRDQIKAVSRSLERQEVAFASMRASDAFAIYQEGNSATVAMLEVREGRCKNIQTLHFDEVGAPSEEVLSSVILQRYSGVTKPAKEVLVSHRLSDQEVLSELLSEEAGRRIKLVRPERGEGASIIDLAVRNAEHSFFERQRKRGTERDTLEGLQRKLGLAKVPDTIECFDISNTGADSMVASRVRFARGLPDKKNYRKYKIKGQEQQDDFAAMEEVIRRRFSGTDAPPDLVVIDGGRGQLSRAVDVFAELDIEGVDLVSLAKSRGTGDTQSPERVFRPGESEPIVLPQDSAEILLLARIRDEAHRFAITFHRKRRQARSLKSQLDDVPGLGPKRKKALLSHFGSVSAVEQAGLEEISRVEGLPAKVAHSVFRHFRAGESD